MIDGAAIVARVVARETFHLDVCYERSPSNIENYALLYGRDYVALQTAFRFPFDPAVTHGLDFILSTTLDSLDFLGEVSGIGSYADVGEEVK